MHSLAKVHCLAAAGTCTVWITVWWQWPLLSCWTCYRKALQYQKIFNCWWGPTLTLCPCGYSNMSSPSLGSSQICQYQIFDECHHCKGEHQYAKVMEIIRDSYKTNTKSHRTQVCDLRQFGFATTFNQSVTEFVSLFSKFLIHVDLHGFLTVTMNTAFICDCFFAAGTPGFGVYGIPCSKNYIGEEYGLLHKLMSIIVFVGPFVSYWSPQMASVFQWHCCATLKWMLCGVCASFKVWSAFFW